MWWTQGERLYKRQFVCCFYFLGVYHWSLGITVHILSPNLEIHVPFGFFRIGWQGIYKEATFYSVKIGKDYKL